MRLEWPAASIMAAILLNDDVGILNQDLSGFRGHHTILPCFPSASLGCEGRVENTASGAPSVVHPIFPQPHSRTQTTDCKPKFNKTALKIAQEKGHKEIEDLLKAKGAKE